ncbi:MAG: hypothetical protein J6S93_04400, partial [Paludibacteraceae bacterium]|nr:hypothetical protein [Paludibacteraceae bacterium]
NSTFEVQLGDQGTANAIVNEDNTIAKVDYAFYAGTTASQQSYDVTSLTQSFTAPTPESNTSYRVGGVVTAKDGCTAEFSADVELYPTPSFEAQVVKTDGTPITGVVCQGSPYAIQLKNNSTTAVVFKVKDNFGNQIGSDINVAAGGERKTNTFVAPNEKTTVEYSISCTTDNGCEATDVPVSVNVGVKPTLDFAPVAAVCSDPNPNSSTPVTVTAAIGATNTANAGTIDFDNGVTGTFSASTLEIKNDLLSLQSYDETRTYSATYTDGAGCQSDPVTVTLSQVATPIISAQVEKDKVCPNDNNRVLLDDASSDFSKGYRYKLYEAEKEANKYKIKGTALKSWVAGNTITSGNRTYGVIDLPRQSASGVYMYAVESENTVNGKVCRDTAFFEYKVNQLPTIDLVVYKNSVAAANQINNGDAVCPETPLIFQVKNSTYNLTSTEWTLSSDKQNGTAPTTSNNADASNISWFAMDRAGTETITILAVNDECSATVRFQYGVSTPAALRITSSETKLPADGTTLFCLGDTETKKLTASGTSSTFSDFVWKKEGNATTLSTVNTLDVNAGDDIVYIVTAKDANGCEATAREIVKTVALPAITLTADPKVVCSGEAITLTSQKLPASYNTYGDNYSFKVRFDKDGDVATDGDQTAFDLPISTLSDKATANVSSSNLTASTAYAYPQVTIDNGDICVGSMVSTTVKVIPSPTIVSVVTVKGHEANKKANTETYMLCSTDAYTVEVKVDPSMFSGNNPSYTSATDFEISVDGVTKTVKGQNIAKFDMEATTGALTHNISITPIIDGNKRGACMAEGTISVDVYANPTIKLYTSNAQHTTNVDASSNDGLAGAYLCASAGLPVGSVWINSYMTVDASTTMKTIEWAAENYSVPAGNTQTSVEISRAVSGLKARITDNNGCVSDWSSPLAVELCEVATPRVSVAKGCEGEAVSVVLGDANADVTTNNTLMNSMYTHYLLSYGSKTVERYLVDDLSGTDAQGRPYYSIPVADVTNGTEFTASAYNTCGSAAGYLSAECKSDPNTATATYNVSVAPQLKITFESMDDTEITKVCPNTSFKVYVEAENFSSSANLTDSEKVLDLELTYVDNGQTKTQRGSISYNTSDDNTKKTFFEIRGGMDYIAGSSSIPFTVTAKNYDGCEVSKTGTIDILSRPTVKLVATKYTRVDGNDVYYCPGVECIIEAQSTSTLKANSFTWYNATNNVSDANTFGTDKELIPTALTNYIDANGNSAYYVTAVSEATGCTSLPSNTLNLKKIPVPAFSAYADPNTVCSGDQTSIKIGTLSDPSAYKFNIINKYGVSNEEIVGSMFSTTTGEPVYNIANYASNAPYGVRLTTPDGCVSDIAVSVTPTDGPIIDWELYNYSKGKVVAAHIHEMVADNVTGVLVPKKNDDGTYVVHTDANYAYANANHKNNVSYYVYDEGDTQKERPQFGHFCVGDVYYLYVRNVRTSQPNEPAILADTFSVNVKGVRKRNGKLFNSNLANRWVALEYGHGPTKNTHFPA